MAWRDRSLYVRVTYTEIGTGAEPTVPVTIVGSLGNARISGDTGTARIFTGKEKVTITGDLGVSRIVGNSGKVRLRRTQ